MRIRQFRLFSAVPILPIFFAILLVSAAPAADTGNLKFDVMGELGDGAKNPAHLIDSSGKEQGQVIPGGTVALPPGDYKLVMPIIGGQITKDNVTIEAGRTHTVLIANVAVMEVSVKDRTGKDPGFGVTVTTTDPPHTKVTSMLSGDKHLFAPNMVDVHVDAPPQGYDWHAVKLEPGKRAHLTMDEVVPAELVVQTVMSKIPLDNATRVVILRAGTQTMVMESAPASEHRFKLDPGDYDIYVENKSGKGKPFTTSSGVHLESGAKVERTVPLD